ncbi:MAG: exo-alpha-sialidase [Victivallales bacterium]|nr:exo-alpha-sialidase [Victivallales bacterium]
MNNRHFLSSLAACLLAATNIAISAPSAELPRKCLELPPGPGNPRNSEGAFITLKTGRILFIYTHFNGSHGGDHGAAVIAQRHSDNNGETWTKQDKIIIENEGAQNVMSVSLLRLANGRIALFYLKKNNDFDCRPILRFSDDEAESWSAPIDCIPREVGYYVLNNDRVIQLASGRLVMPLCQHAKQGDTQSDYMGTLLCYLSDDNGLTWHRSQQEWKVFNDNGQRITVQEPGVVELKDGHVMMFIRSSCGSQMVSYSSDFGETWTKSQPSDMLSPLSPASIKRIPKTGDLLLVWNNHRNIPLFLAGKRVPLSMAVSKDDGRTWTLIKTLEGNLRNGWYCYIAIHFVGDDILLGYCALDGLCHSRVTKVPVSWLYKDIPFRPYECSPSIFDNVPNGPFTTLETSLGTWTAAEGQAEVMTYTRGKGVNLKGGNEMTMELALATPQKLSDVALTAERFTSAPPYSFAVEAFADRKWTIVFTQDSQTKVGKRHPIVWSHPSLTTQRLRFRCTSPRGVIVGDPQTASLNAFFED